MSAPALLADHLDQQSEAILAHWRQTVERGGDAPDAENLSRSEFLDHVPAILDRLADRLRGRPADAEAEGRAHGEHRWRQGYDIAEIVNELGCLRATLCDATARFARAHAWGLAPYESAMAAINEVLDGTIAESVRQFQAESTGETRAALKEVKEGQRAAEEAWLVAQNERATLQSILNSLPVAVWRLGPDGGLISVNPEAEVLHGGPLDGTVPEFRLLHPDGSPYGPEDLPGNRALRGETLVEQEVTWVIDDAERTVALTASPLTDPSNNVVGAILVGQDVSQWKRLENDLQSQRQLAEEASLHKTRLVTALSHDVRTPLNAVVLAAHLLEHHHKQDDAVDPEIAECIRTIHNSVKNVLDLLGGLLDLSKIDAGAMPAELSRFPLEPVLAECLSSVATQAKRKGLEVRYEPGPLDGLSFESDRPKLKQVLANLLSNALRYTERGHIRLYGGHIDGRVLIGVEDTGVGIPAEDHERIYDEFSMLGNLNRKPGEGTGLGLAICRRLANLLNGEILLTSVPGRGSTFILSLPAAAASPCAASSAHQPTPRDPSSGPAGAVLIAEDHVESRQFLARVLKRMGYRPLEAADGHEVLAIARSEPDLLAILMDVNMPGMDGVAATLALRADPLLKGLVIFALTGDVTVDNQNRIADAGVDGYLEKPVTWEALRAALDSTVGKRSLPK